MGEAYDEAPADEAPFDAPASERPSLTGWVGVLGSVAGCVAAFMLLGMVYGPWHPTDWLGKILFWVVTAPFLFGVAVIGGIKGLLFGKVSKALHGGRATAGKIAITLALPALGIPALMLVHLLIAANQGPR